MAWTQTHLAAVEHDSTVRDLRGELNVRVLQDDERALPTCRCTFSVINTVIAPVLL